MLYKLQNVSTKTVYLNKFYAVAKKRRVRLMYNSFTHIFNLRFLTTVKLSIKTCVVRTVNLVSVEIIKKIKLESKQNFKSSGVLLRRG